MDGRGRGTGGGWNVSSALGLAFRVMGLFVSLR